MLVYRWQASQDSPGVGIGKGKQQKEGEELADTGAPGQILQREARVPRCHGVLQSQGVLWAPLDPTMTQLGQTGMLRCSGVMFWEGSTWCVPPWDGECWVFSHRTVQVTLGRGAVPR